MCVWGVGEICRLELVSICQNGNEAAGEIAMKPVCFSQDAATNAEKFRRFAAPLSKSTLICQ